MYVTFGRLGIVRHVKDVPAYDTYISISNCRDRLDLYISYLHHFRAFDDFAVTAAHFRAAVIINPVPNRLTAFALLRNFESKVSLSFESEVHFAITMIACVISY